MILGVADADELRPSNIGILRGLLVALAVHGVIFLGFWTVKLEWIPAHAKNAALQVRLKVLHAKPPEAVAVVPVIETEAIAEAQKSKETPVKSLQHKEPSRKPKVTVAKKDVITVTKPPSNSLTKYLAGQGLPSEVIESSSIEGRTTATRKLGGLRRAGPESYPLGGGGIFHREGGHCFVERQEWSESGARAVMYPTQCHHKNSIEQSFKRAVEQRLRK